MFLPEQHAHVLRDKYVCCVAFTTSHLAPYLIVAREHKEWPYVRDSFCLIANPFPLLCHMLLLLLLLLSDRQSLNSRAKHKYALLPFPNKGKVVALRRKWLTFCLRLLIATPIDAFSLSLSLSNPVSAEGRHSVSGARVNPGDWGQKIWKGRCGVFFSVGWLCASERTTPRGQGFVPWDCFR